MNKNDKNRKIAIVFLICFFVFIVLWCLFNKKDQPRYRYKATSEKTISPKGGGGH